MRNIGIVLSDALEYSLSESCIKILNSTQFAGYDNWRLPLIED